MTIFFLSNSYSQKMSDGAFPDESDSLYIYAIKEHIKYFKSNPNRYIPYNSEKEVFYISMENYLQDLPAEIDGFKLVQLWGKNRWDYYKKNNKKLKKCLIIKKQEIELQITKKLK